MASDVTDSPGRINHPGPPIAAALRKTEKHTPIPHGRRLRLPIHRGTREHETTQPNSTNTTRHDGSQNDWCTSASRKNNLYLHLHPNPLPHFVPTLYKRCPCCYWHLLQAQCPKSGIDGFPFLHGKQEKPVTRVAKELHARACRKRELISRIQCTNRRSGNTRSGRRSVFTNQSNVHIDNSGTLNFLHQRARACRFLSATSRHEAPPGLQLRETLSSARRLWKAGTMRSAPPRGATIERARSWARSTRLTRALHERRSTAILSSLVDRRWAYSIEGKALCCRRTPAREICGRRACIFKRAGGRRRQRRALPSS